MVLERLPKITKVKVTSTGTQAYRSSEFSIDEFTAMGFLFDNTAGNSLTVKAVANAEGGDMEPVPFMLKKSDAAGFESVTAEGKALTDGGAFVAAVTGDSLGKKGYDRVRLEFTSAASITSVYVLQTQPRYSE